MLIAQMQNQGLNNKPLGPGPTQGKGQRLDTIQIYFIIIYVAPNNGPIPHLYFQCLGTGYSELGLPS